MNRILFYFLFYLTYLRRQILYSCVLTAFNIKRISINQQMVYPSLSVSSALYEEDTKHTVRYTVSQKNLYRDPYYLVI